LLIEHFGSRVTLLVGFSCLVAAFLVMFGLWSERSSYWVIALAYASVGFGVGIAGTPASQSLTTSVPVRRVGMASGTADLQRDLGGAIIQSLLGALLTAGYATAIAGEVGRGEAASQQQVSDQVVSVLQKSYGAAADVAARYPQYEQQIIAAAREAFVAGQAKAFGAAIILGLLGVAVVATFFPRKAREQELIAEYHRIDGDVTDEGSVS
jgi:MFS family permease